MHQNRLYLSQKWSEVENHPYLGPTSDQLNPGWGGAGVGVGARIKSSLGWRESFPHPCLFHLCFPPTAAPALTPRAPVRRAGPSLRPAPPGCFFPLLVRPGLCLRHFLSQFAPRVAPGLGLPSPTLLTSALTLPLLLCVSPARAVCRVDLVILPPCPPPPRS